MKKFLLILTSTFLFASIGFSEMKKESQEEKDLCLGVKKARSPQYQNIYDALNMLLNDKNCFIKNIVVYPKDKKANGELAAYRPNCKIKLGNISPEAILQFEIDSSKANKNEPFYKKAMRTFQEAETKEIPTEFKFRRGQSDALKNADDYYLGNKEEGEKGFRELAVEAGACKSAEQEPLTEPNQPAFVQSNSSSSSAKGHKN